MPFDLTNKLTQSELLNDPMLVKIREDNELKAAADELLAAEKAEAKAHTDRQFADERAKDWRTAFTVADDHFYRCARRLKAARARLTALNNNRMENSDG